MKTRVRKRTMLPPIPIPIPPLGIGSKIFIEDDGGHFSCHPDRKVIKGISPVRILGYDLRPKGRTMEVLSLKENLEFNEVIVLTDGKYSYWFNYWRGEHYKKFLKLTV